MERTPWQQLMATAHRQHQVFTTAQAVSAGIPSSTLADIAAKVAIADLGYGLWACGGAPNTYRRKLWVAQLSLGPQVVFTGRTALWLRRVITSTPPTVDVLAGPKLHLRPRKGLHCFRGSLLPHDEPVNVEGHKTLSVYRAFTDAAGVAPTESLVRWLPAMDRLRLGNLPELRSYCEERGRFAGVVALRAAMAILESDLPHSGDERFARKMLRSAGLRPYPRPYPVKAGDRILAEIDLAFPDVLYGVEIDGPHHLLRDVAAADKSRDRALSRLHWTIERFPVQDVRADPVGFVAEVRRGLVGAKTRYAGISNQ